MDWIEVTVIINSVFIMAIFGMAIYALVSISEVRAVIGRMVKEINIINTYKEEVDNSQSKAIRTLNKK